MVAGDAGFMRIMFGFDASALGLQLLTQCYISPANNSQGIPLAYPNVNNRSDEATYVKIEWFKSHLAVYGVALEASLTAPSLQGGKGPAQRGGRRGGRGRGSNKGQTTEAPAAAVAATREIQNRLTKRAAREIWFSTPLVLRNKRHFYDKSTNTRIPCYDILFLYVGTIDATKPMPTPTTRPTSTRSNPCPSCSVLPPCA